MKVSDLKLEMMCFFLEERWHIGINFSMQEHVGGIIGNMQCLLYLQKRKESLLIDE